MSQNRFGQLVRMVASGHFDKDLGMASQFVVDVTGPPDQQQHRGVFRSRHDGDDLVDVGVMMSRHPFEFAQLKRLGNASDLLGRCVAADDRNLLTLEQLSNF